ncbi:hypothetical protein CCHR01_00363 [Colletotrichum chrysophilum]|uniref:Uncharacterized protein n=1 Tax=Colletotrichum chrysophilum TaxID=1836956 RepID=A0AAD9B289_9PEZI|nr:hypothetical protein CCHR01_00363 [Colletotrichum chrysophilum]
MAAFVSHHLPLLFSLHLPRPSASNPARRVACLPVVCLHSSPSHPSSHCRILAHCAASSAEQSTPANRESSGQLSPPTTTLHLSLPSSGKHLTTTRQKAPRPGLALWLSLNASATS